MPDQSLAEMLMKAPASLWAAFGDKGREMAAMTPMDQAKAFGRGALLAPAGLGPGGAVTAAGLRAAVPAAAEVVTPQLQALREALARGEEFSVAHRDAFPELYARNAARQAEMEAAVRANTEAKRAGAPYPSPQWKALFPGHKWE